MRGTLEPTDGIEQFGKFILRRRLGAGGMAEVYLAEMVGPSGFGKLVALKRILPELSNDDEFVSSLISEARLGGSLNHPNIVQTLELGREGDHYYLAMEYVQGLTLASLLQHRRRTRAALPLSVVVNITRQLCDGLAYAHTATDPRGQPLRMIHRDLKPDNILVSLFGAVKITDFGVAKANSNLRRTLTSNVVKGTIAYMSPEQAGCEELDHRSDLYSLGAILFEMLTLEPLYPEVQGIKGLYVVQEGRIDHRLPLLAQYPRPLVQLVTRLLAADPAQRFSSATEVKRELMTLAASLPASLVDLNEVVRGVLEAQAAVEVTDRASRADARTQATPRQPAGHYIPSTADEMTMADDEPMFPSYKGREQLGPPSGAGAGGGAGPRGSREWEGQRLDLAETVADVRFRNRISPLGDVKTGGRLEMGSGAELEATTIADPRRAAIPSSLEGKTGPANHLLEATHKLPPGGALSGGAPAGPGRALSRAAEEATAPQLPPAMPKTVPPAARGGAAAARVASSTPARPLGAEGEEVLRPGVKIGRKAVTQPAPAQNTMLWGIAAVLLAIALGLWIFLSRTG